MKRYIIVISLLGLSTGIFLGYTALDDDFGLTGNYIVDSDNQNNAGAEPETRFSNKSLDYVEHILPEDRQKVDYENVQDIIEFKHSVDLKEIDNKFDRDYYYIGATIEDANERMVAGTIRIDDNLSSVETYSHSVKVVEIRENLDIDEELIFSTKVAYGSEQYPEFLDQHDTKFTLEN